jgi:hypothetical protein
MKTLKHKLFSMDESVDAPEVTGEHVLNLIHMADSAKDLTDFKRRMEQDSYFSEIRGLEYNNLVHTAGKLKKSKNLSEKSKYQDDIYLQIAQYELGKEDVKGAAKLQDKIGEIYERLYGQEEE